MTGISRFKDDHARQPGLVPDYDGAHSGAPLRELAALERPGRFEHLRPGLRADQPILSSVLSSFKGLLRRHLGLIITITLLTAAVAAVGVSRMKTYYTATASVILDQRGTRPLDPDTQRPNAILPLNPDGEVELLKSDNVALRVVERLRLMRDPEFVPPSGQLSKLIALIRSYFPAEPDGDAAGSQAAGSSSAVPESEWADNSGATHEPMSEMTAKALRNLVSSVEIRRRGLSDIIAIEAKSLKPARAAQIANAYAEAYLDAQVAPKLRGIERAERVLSRQLEELDRELKRSEVQMGLRQTYQDTQLRLRALTQQRAAVAPEARIVSFALTPSGSGIPFGKIVGMLTSILASFGLALGIAYVRDIHTRRVQTDEEIEQISGVPNLASLPGYGFFGRRRGLNPADDVVHRPASAYADTVRRLYFNLQIMTSGRSRLGSVLITSTEREEGKTTLALSLARTAARAGSRVLIVDCDLCHPRLHALLGLDNEAGLVNLLMNPSDAQALIQEDPMSPCRVITSGNMGDIAPEWLLQVDKLRATLRRLGTEFDAIILDAPPVKHSADPVILMSCADLAVFAVRTSWASPADVQSSIHQLHRASNADIVTVLTFAMV
jgi:capsular exopolysaccharide synthesis family protein